MRESRETTEVKTERGLRKRFREKGNLRTNRGKKDEKNERKIEGKIQAKACSCLLYRLVQRFQ